MRVRIGFQTLSQQQTVVVDNNFKLPYLFKTTTPLQGTTVITGEFNVKTIQKKNIFSKLHILEFQQSPKCKIDTPEMHYISVSIYSWHSSCFYYLPRFPQFQGTAVRCAASATSTATNDVVPTSAATVLPRLRL